MPSSVLRLVQFLGLACALATLTVLGWAPPASAHAELLSTTPADGATVQAHPSTVTFTFNENINPSFVQVRVKDSQGASSDLGATVQGTAVIATLGTLPAGTTQVAYRVTSADGHPISGAITYTATSGAKPITHQTMSADQIAARVTSAPNSPTDAAPSSGFPWWYALVGALSVALLVGGAVSLRRGSTA